MFPSTCIDRPNACIYLAFRRTLLHRWSDVQDNWNAQKIATFAAAVVSCHPNITLPIAAPFVAAAYASLGNLAIALLRSIG
jgi:hypothetical protein